MKTLKNFILLLMVMSIPLLGFSQQENTDAVYNVLAKEYSLNSDGSMEFHYHKELKLLTHYAFHRLFGETFIVYDPTYQELKINEAYTVMADGRRVDSPENAFNEVLPHFANDIPAYNHLREMVVTHTGLEVGATIVLDYTIITKSPFIPYLMGDETIGENVPVNEMEIVVKVPPRTDLYYKIMNIRTAPEINRGLDEEVYTWTFRNLGANSMESYQDGSISPRLMFTTARDLSQVYFKFVDQMAFKAMASSLAMKHAKDFLEGNEDDITKMLKLQDVVLNQVKLAEIPLEYTNFKVRQPAVVWNQANATSLEKALLLSNWLIQANINAVPVALIPNNEFDRSNGNLYCFKGFAVQVNPRETGRFYLSVTHKNDQNLVYDLKDYTALQLDGAIESLRTFQETAETDNEISLSGELSMPFAESITGSLAMTLEGANNPFLKLSQNKDVVKSYLSGGLGSSAVKDYSLDKLNEEECKATFTIEKNNPLEHTGDYFFLTLPGLSVDASHFHLEGMSDERETPLKLPQGIDVEYSYTITLPEGWKMVTPEADIEIKNEIGTVEINISQKKNKLVIDKEIKVQPDISVQQYPDLLKLVRTWVDERYNKLVLEEGGK